MSCATWYAAWALVSPANWDGESVCGLTAVANDPASCSPGRSTNQVTPAKTTTTARTSTTTPLLGFFFDRLFGFNDNPPSLCRHHTVHKIYLNVSAKFRFPSAEKKLMEFANRNAAGERAVSSSEGRLIPWIR